jgi:hypothetical protein
MQDLRAAKIVSHRRNIQRYSRLLATDITELDRDYLHKQIAQEGTELERWLMQSGQDQLEHAVAVQAVSRKQNGKSRA